MHEYVNGSCRDKILKEQHFLYIGRYGYKLAPSGSIIDTEAMNFVFYWAILYYEVAVSCWKIT